MNAIEENAFVEGWRAVARTLPKPTAILCISAHWETRGTSVTAMPHPRTIHDFGGFPRELFAVQYPAPGSPVLAQETQQTVTKTSVGLDTSWGLDRLLSVVKHLTLPPMFRLQLSLTTHPADHYELAKELVPLRRRGVLIIGGNMVPWV
jgi:4,5-DOPA dioxygenase extradiol